MHGFCALHIFTGQNDGAVLLELFDSFSVQNVLAGRAVVGVVFCSVIVGLFDEIQASRFTHLFQNGGCIGCTRDFNGDTVVALQIDLCLFAVLLRPLFQLVAGI